jgi:fatty-acyl-CoA synthase
MSLFGLADILIRPSTVGDRDLSRAALVAGECQVTYGELMDRVLRLATGLHRRGFRRGDVVALYLRNRVEYVELIFAAAHLGGVLVPINYLLRPSEVAHIVADSGARWLVTEATLLGGVASSVGPEFVVVVEGAAGASAADSGLSYDDLVADEADAPRAFVESSERVLLQYTSGTTGFPKGAVHTHASVLINTLAQVVDYQITSQDTHIVVPSLSWAAGLHCLTLSTIWRGGTVVLKPSGGFDADELADLVELHRVTTGMFAPSVLRMILDARVHERRDLSSLRLVLSGGEPVAPAELGELQRLLPAVDVRQGYGVSEFPSVALHLPAEDVVKQGGAGWSTVATNVRIARPDGGDTAVGEHGEIVLRSPASSLAYGDGTSAVVDGWLHTGDRGYVDDRGVVHIAGRSKEMFVSGGLNVYPAEVERVLAAFPGVREVAVVGVPDRRFGEVGHAFVVCDAPATLDEDALRHHAERELAGFKVPRMWTFRAEALPRTVTGKLRRSEMH